MLFENDYRIRTRRIDISSGEIINMANRGDIEIFPTYKRNAEWKNNLKSKYIESALLGLPLSQIIFEESEDAFFSVVDGSQRLNAVIQFMSGEYSLSTLPILNEYNGLYFSELNYSEQLRLERAMFSVEVIDRNSHPKLKCEFLKRLNIGRTEFIAQQARNYAYPNMYIELTSFADSLSQYFNFSISEKSHGGRKFKSELREQQFVLSLIAIEHINKNPNLIDSELLLSNIYEQLAFELNSKEKTYDKKFIEHYIQRVLYEFQTNRLSLVYRSYSSIKMYQKSQLSMNDFLNKFLQFSFNADNLNANNFNTKTNFDFFKEDIAIRRLGRYL